MKRRLPLELVNQISVLQISIYAALIFTSNGWVKYRRNQ